MAQFSTSRNLPWARSTSEYVQPVTQPQPMPPGINQSQLSSSAIPHSVSNVSTATGFSFGSPAIPPLSQTPQPYSTLSHPAQNTGGLAQVQAQAVVAMQQAHHQSPSLVSPMPSPVSEVSYPLPRSTQTTQPSTQKQRVYTGVVTKLHENFGLVDEEVFFQPACVKGQLPKVGDRVLVEATYNVNMPFKWNATRIQMLPNQSPHIMHTPERIVKSKFQPAPSGNKPGPIGSTTPHPPPLMGTQATLPPAHSKTQMSKERFGRDRNRDHMDRRDRKDFRQSLPPRRRSRTPPPRARTPPPRKRMRTIPRYVVQVPKISLALKSANVVTVKSRYTNMYIPSDFFSTNYSWSEVFAVDHPFQLGSSCNFVVMHKDVEPVTPSDAVLDPPDADYLYSAKVMLLSTPSLSELYHKSCSLSEDSSEAKESFQHPTRLINFLVGCKGKNEPMAIGGPWSQSLDGLNPDTDPKVLIKTAIRTTSALTGIDLSHCAQWYRFAEISYHRPEEVHKGKTTPARVETTVIFLPDVWSCMATRQEWQSLQETYKKQLLKKLAAPDGGEESEKDEETSQAIPMEEVHEPTNYKELDPKCMKIAELRQELEARTVSSKGLKSQLIARLTKTLKSEQEKDEGEKEDSPSSSKDDKQIADPKDSEKKKEEDERKREKDKVSLEKKYTFPENPGILVHPSPVAKSGKFDCSVISLSVLLDYRPEDNKEHSFEVSLFAEMFNEMLMRDFGFEIFKTLYIMPEKKEDEKEKKDKKEDEKKEKKQDEKESKDKSIKKEDEGKDNKTKVEEEEGKDDGENEDDKRDKKRKRKFVTVDPKLLLSCVYFDQNHSGYIVDKDLEDIVHVLGLNLSRSQVKKLVQKALTRDQFNYRKCSDREEGEAQKFDKTDIEDRALIELEDIQFQVNGSPSAMQSPSTPKTKSKRKASGKEMVGTMVTYKGSLVDLDSLMTRLGKSEESRNELEAKLQVQSTDIDKLKKKYTDVHEQNDKAKDEVKRLKSELEEQTEQCEMAENLNRGYVKTLFKAKDALGDMLGKISDCVDGQLDAIESMDDK